MPSEMLSTKWVSPVITCSYPHLGQPGEDLSGRSAYSISIPLPKSETEAVAALKKAMSNAAVNEWGEKFAGLAGVMNFVADGNPDDPVYENTVKFSAKSLKRQPGCVDEFLRPIPPEEIEEKFYPGCKVRVSVSAYATDKSGKKTIAFALNNVMFVADGERIGGSSSATDDFGAFAQTPDSDFATDGNLF